MKNKSNFALPRTLGALQYIVIAEGLVLVITHRQSSSKRQAYVSQPCFTNGGGLVLQMKAICRVYPCVSTNHRSIPWPCEKVGSQESAVHSASRNPLWDFPLPSSFLRPCCFTTAGPQAHLTDDSLVPARWRWKLRDDWLRGVWWPRLLPCLHKKHRWKQLESKKRNSSSSWQQKGTLTSEEVKQQSPPTAMWVKEKGLGCCCFKFGKLFSS